MTRRSAAFMGCREIWGRFGRRYSKVWKGRHWWVYHYANCGGKLSQVLGPPLVPTSQFLLLNPPRSALLSDGICVFDLHLQLAFKQKAPNELLSMQEMTPRDLAVVGVVLENAITVMTPFRHCTLRLPAPRPPLPKKYLNPMQSIGQLISTQPRKRSSLSHHY
ncbi:hypothetical protein BV22DRAFT_1119444 [Leucogyrophana mollusca]|uniref:Uncharacterized protein n=1 Tax=Leucogyrophana mollusca TaxID=85980 RepID=A0ACB8BJY9_9AGAM|nr:hypothetical protein BV22DRAFT_1119444 [Leucogyrophana mollusca]